MRILFTIFLMGIVTSLFCKTKVHEYSFSAGYNSGDWSFTGSSRWKFTSLEGTQVLHLVEPGQMGTIRAPRSAAIFTGQKFTDFEIEVTAKCLTDTTNLRRDVCIFFGYQDSLHYYYAHFSGISDQVHNIIAIVDNKDREKINAEPPGSSAAQLKSDQWYKLRIVRNAQTGTIKAYVNEDTHPVLTAVDKTFGTGYVGVGSFDDTAYFKDIYIRSL